MVKNFLLSSERSAERKIKELILSVRLENTLSKDDILALYLNEIFLGQNSYGVTAAAQTYFNKTLDQLEPHEAAYLATLPKKPAKLHPVRNKEAALGRRNYVLREMYQNGYLDQVVYEAEKELPLRSVQNGDFEGFRTALPDRDYFTDEIRRQLSRDFGEEEFFTGGLTIRATENPKLQDVAAASLRQGLEEYDRARGVWRPTGVTHLPEGALSDEASWRQALADTKFPRDIEGWYPAVVLEVGNNDARIGIEGVEEDDDGHWIPAKDVTWARRLGEDGSLGRKARVAGDLLKVGEVVHVRRMVKDADGSFVRWTLRQIPEVQGGFMAMDVNTGRVIAMQGGFSYQHSVYNRATQAQRQPGSSFKPFVYAAALDSGFSPATIVIDAPIEVESGGKIWRPKNASNEFYGPTPLRTGIEQSRNLMTVRLAQEIGMDTVAGYAERFGVYERMNPFLANSLGSEETTLVQDGRGLRDVCQWRRARGAHIGGPRAGPLGADDLSPRPPRLCGLFRSSAGRWGGTADQQQSRTRHGCHHGLSADLDDARCCAARNRQPDGKSAGSDGRQDRDDQRCARRLVCRLHFEHRGRLLYRI